MSEADAEAVQALPQDIDLVLQGLDVGAHLLVLLRLFEVVGAAVGRIHALQVQVPASRARCLAVALDLAPFALIARDRDISVPLRALLRALRGGGCAIGIIVRRFPLVRWRMCVVRGAGVGIVVVVVGGGLSQVVTQCDLGDLIH